MGVGRVCARQDPLYSQSVRDLLHVQTALEAQSFLRSQASTMITLILVAVDVLT